MPASRSVVSVLLRAWETLLSTLKAGPVGGYNDGPPFRARLCIQLTGAPNHLGSWLSRSCWSSPTHAT